MHANSSAWADENQLKTEKMRFSRQWVILTKDELLSIEHFLRVRWHFYKFCLCSYSLIALFFKHSYKFTVNSSIYRLFNSFYQPFATVIWFIQKNTKHLLLMLRVWPHYKHPHTASFGIHPSFTGTIFCFLLRKRNFNLTQ